MNKRRSYTTSHHIHTVSASEQTAIVHHTTFILSVLVLVNKRPSSHRRLHSAVRSPVENTNTKSTLERKYHGCCWTWSQKKFLFSTNNVTHTFYFSSANVSYTLYFSANVSRTFYSSPNVSHSCSSHSHALLSHSTVALVTVTVAGVCLVHTGWA